MNQGKFVFAQIMDRVLSRRLQTCVDRYRGDHKVQTFKCADYFRVMAFAQLTHRESLRNIVACLNAVPEKMVHMEIRSGISRNNLSHTTQQRDWRIFADFAQILIEQARLLYNNDPLPVEINATVYYDSAANNVEIRFNLLNDNELRSVQRCYVSRKRNDF